MPSWRRLVACLEGRSAVADGAVLVWLLVACADLYELPHPHLVWGCDLTLYQQAVRSWFGGAAPYAHYQLAGPYVVETGAILYPPITLVLLAPSLLLPLPFWLLAPLVITGAVIYRLRPQPWAMLAIGFCFLYRPSYELIMAGNPVIWLMAALATAIHWRPAAALVLLKPSLFPFALVGIRSRGWWLIVGLFALVSLALLPQTLDWLTAVINGRGPRSGLLYSYHDVPLLSVPYIAWLGSNGQLEAVTTKLGIQRVLRRKT